MPTLTPPDPYEFQKKLFDDAWSRLNEQTKKREDYAKTYTTTIIGLAYGGFFALWAFAKTLLPPSDRQLILASASLLTVSLFIFVVFEIIKVAQASSSISKANKLLCTTAKNRDFDEFHRLFAQMAEDTQRDDSRFFRFWQITFYPCVFFGVSGAALLFFLMARAAAGL